MTPKLRFSEFTDGWKTVKLSDLSDRGQYGIGAAAKSFDGANKYLRITDIDEQTRKFKLDALSSPSGKLNDKYLLGSGDLVFARTGASTGRTYLYDGKDGNVYFAGFLIRFHINKAVPYFVYVQTFRKKYSKWVTSVSARSGQPGINAEEYGELTLCMSSKPEQQKIADFLTAVDDKISAIDKNVELLKQYKKGVMQKIFNQEVRFKGKNNEHYSDWNKKQLKNILRESLDKSSKNNQYELLSSTSRGLFRQSDYFKKDTSSENNSGYKILRKGQLVFSPQNIWMGNINLNKEFEVGIVSPSYKIYSVAGVELAYLENLLRSPKMLYDYRQSSEQGASIVRRNLDIDSFLSIKIDIPFINEQQKIADFLTKLDDKINITEQKLNQTKQFKKALLQKMFV